MSEHEREAHKPPGAAPDERKTQRTWPRLASLLCAISSSDTSILARAGVPQILATSHSAQVFHNGAANVRQISDRPPSGSTHAQMTAIK